ncbi:hypothetical protein [Candidatus Uabimicrobium amorphum]|uniref:Phytanoyl-CoA dioxygenase n=1 Tax=Uabimicrobium amorphum TaxID=2596890 RepID=A0A5S9F6D7_UABAM|nr:hypothetical protein [Candidatus Uabimicrobium amorphum]BBM86559.1 hypothetical protein UABAM_04945 [Candidatus Uabimicrobium amorphum]
MLKEIKKQQYDRAIAYLESQYDPVTLLYSQHKNHLMQEIKSVAPDVNILESWLDYMLDCFIHRSPHLNKKERTVEGWQKIFPRYPVDREGFAVSFAIEDSDTYCRMLDDYGVVVVRVFDKQECERSIAAMFEEINNTPAPYRKMNVSPDNPISWEKCNWPSRSKFLLSRPAFHFQAFKNRTSETVYRVFCHIWKEERLRVTIDNWGIMRGTKDLLMKNGVEDRPQWRKNVKPHWDYNPWLFHSEMQKGRQPGYQAIIAFSDQTSQTGCHLTLPGCTQFLELWCRENEIPKDLLTKRRSHRPVANDPVRDYMQEIPIRQGDMIIWSWGQLHGNTMNFASQMRLLQYIRMFPASEVDTSYEEYDRYACRRILRQYQSEYAFDFSRFSLQEKRLLGVEDY